jgi:protein gp37
VAEKTGIEWTDSTWSPVRARVKQDAAEISHQKGYSSLIRIAEKMAGRVGPHCEHASHGCDNCYAETNNHRCLPENGTGLPFDRRSRDLVEVFLDEKVLRKPLSWKGPRRIFVENQSDLFGEWVPDELIDRVFAIAALCPQHTFQMLTKRAHRMFRYLSDNNGVEARRRVQDVLAPAGNHRGPEARCLVQSWPLRNVWLGVSTEDQKTADERIPYLLQTPAAMRFISYEPALGPIDLNSTVGGTLWIGGQQRCGPTHLGIGTPDCPRAPHHRHHERCRKGLDWVIVGGESGPGARPANPQWFRSVRDQCLAAGVKLFFKQWGAHVPANYRQESESTFRWSIDSEASGIDQKTKYTRPHIWGDGIGSVRLSGKKTAGALLDGREYKEFPTVPRP